MDADPMKVDAESRYESNAYVNAFIFWRTQSSVSLALTRITDQHTTSKSEVI